MLSNHGHIAMSILISCYSFNKNARMIIDVEMDSLMLRWIKNNSGGPELLHDRRETRGILELDDSCWCVGRHESCREVFDATWDFRPTLTPVTVGF
ncbi:hypothetical protein V6N13_133466 [Hibiscus sabdariffa]